MRCALTISWFLALAACKPADEPARRAPREAAEPARTLDLGERPGPAPTSDAPARPDAAPEGAATAPPTIDARVTVGSIERDEPDVTSGPDTTGGADAAEAVALLDDVGDGIDVGVDTLAAPETPETVEAVAMPGEPVPADDPRWPPLAATLDRAATTEQQELARALNKSGLEKHRKSQLDLAIDDYRAALTEWPAHPFSRYNLACALALQGKRSDALLMLRALEHLAPTQTAARDRLRAARVDADFASLRDDPHFRALTGATEILVAWNREDERTVAKRLAELLRNARWSARPGPRAWNALDGLPTRNVVLYRADDAVARSVVEEIASALTATVPDIVAEPATTLPPEAPPIVVWLPPPTALAPDEPAPPGDPVLPDDPVVPAAPGDPPPPAESLTVVKDFIGLTLVPDGPTPEALELKPTGFFTWEIGPGATHGDSKVTRTGRYQLRGPSLVLTYKETIATPVAGGTPRLEVHENQTLTVLLTVPEPGTLAIESRPYRPR